MGWDLGRARGAPSVRLGAARKPTNLSARSAGKPDSRRQKIWGEVAPDPMLVVSARHDRITALHAAVLPCQEPAYCASRAVTERDVVQAMAA